MRRSDDEPSERPTWTEFIEHRLPGPLTTYAKLGIVSIALVEGVTFVSRLLNEATGWAAQIVWWVVSLLKLLL